jgi:DNA polymerase IV (archaeal DinB-like DNA polymerase)
MALLSSFADKFEQVSIDEAFLDVSERLGGDYEKTRALALDIKTELESREKLTCSIGVGPNKSAAKIASDLQKPDGLTVVSPDRIKEFLSPLPIRAISGIGPKTEQFLESRGVQTIGDLQKVPGKELVKYFGKTGVWLWGVANGLERIEVKQRPMRSLNAEHTFDKDVQDKKKVLQKLDELVDRLHKRVQNSKVDFRVVGIKIRFSHFQTFSRENTLPLYTSTKQAILQESRNLFREFEYDKRKVRLIGVFVADFNKLEDLEELEKEGSLEEWLQK